MSKSASKSRFGSFFEILGSAVAVSAAMERGARPAQRDLQKLGIDPEQFGRIGRP